MYGTTTGAAHVAENDISARTLHGWLVQQTMVNTTLPSADSPSSPSPPTPAVGSTIEVYWVASDKFYLGTVANYDAARNRHTIVYETGNSERLVLSKERWRIPRSMEEKKEHPQIGTTIEVWWPIDKAFYSGTVNSYDKETKMHHIKYDDGESEKLVLDDEVWRLTERARLGGVLTRTPANKGERPKIGDDIEVYWPDDDIFYPGTVTSFNEKDGKHRIDYLDNEIEHLKMDNEKWRFVRKTITKPKRKGSSSSKRS